MIGQFLSNTNESTTVSILQKFLELNKAFVAAPKGKLMRSHRIVCPFRSALVKFTYYGKGHMTDGGDAALVYSR